MSFRKIRGLLDRFLNQSSSQSVIGLVAERFVRVFAAHGIEASQIPRFLPELSLGTLSTEESLLEALSPTLIDRTAQLFGVRSEWLEGIDDQIYSYTGTGKEPALLLGHLEQIRPSPSVHHHFPLRILTTRKKLDKADPASQLLAPILVEPIGDLGEDTVYRYHVYCDGFDWSHYPSRIELKAIARLSFKAFQCPVPLFEISHEQMDDVLEGKVIPSDFVNGCPLTDPSLEDYALSRQESGVAKETDELDEVLKYIETQGLEQFGRQHDQCSESPDVSSPISPNFDAAPLVVSEKASTTDKWGPVRNAAQALWGQDSTLPIAEVARRIKQMASFKASAYEVGTIHKRIASLAPEGVKGKPGRKAKKSPSLLSELIKK